MLRAGVRRVVRRVLVEVHELRRRDHAFAHKRLDSLLCVGRCAVGALAEELPAVVALAGLLHEHALDDVAGLALDVAEHLGLDLDELVLVLHGAEATRGCRCVVGLVDFETNLQHVALRHDLTSGEARGETHGGPPVHKVVVHAVAVRALGREEETVNGVLEPHPAKKVLELEGLEEVLPHDCDADVGMRHRDGELVGHVLDEFVASIPVLARRGLAVPRENVEDNELLVADRRVEVRHRGIEDELTEALEVRVPHPRTGVEGVHAAHVLWHAIQLVHAVHDQDALALDLVTDFVFPKGRALPLHCRAGHGGADRGSGESRLL
eukprot:PhM_4_TR17607/c0_g1_i1/m.28903